MSTFRSRAVQATVAMAAIALCVPAATSASAGRATSARPASAAPECESKDEVTVQLKWVAQSQFAGYYAAKDLGYYDDACLDVTIQEAGGNIVPMQQLASGNVEFAVDHAINAMVAREEGADPVNIAQVFQRGGYLQVGWADSGIKTIDDLRGTKVGSWGYGNELILYAALRGAGIEPNVDAEIVQQPFDTSLLLRREVDTIQAKTYNEYAQLLEATNPDTGELYQPEDFVAINLNELGYDSLEDGIYAQADWLADGDNADIAERFLEASFKGWASCRDDFEGCVNIVLDAGTTLGQGHMTWMLNEINKLIWPSPAGIGMMDADAWDRTVKVGLDGEIITAAPSDDAYRTDLAQAAVDALTAAGVDVNGTDYAPIDVQVTPGGE
jgi:NitT/TauT family transport system substrate-binding protein